MLIIYPYLVMPKAHKAEAETEPRCGEEYMMRYAHETQSNCIYSA